MFIKAGSESYDQSIIRISLILADEAETGKRETTYLFRARVLPCLEFAQPRVLQFFDKAGFDIDEA